MNLFDKLSYKFLLIPLIIVGALFAGIVVFFVFDKRSETGINVLKVLFNWDVGF